MADFLELCKKRFSARKFTDEPVKAEDLQYILECVRMAPSGVNFPPWKFVIVKSPEAQEKLYQCYERDWFQTAPLFVIAYKNTSQEWVRKYDGKHIGDVDVAIAVEHLCLAATERGLGTCWICNFIPEKLAQLFPQSEEFVPVALIPIGHIAPDCPVKEKSRKPLSEITETI